MPGVTVAKFRTLEALSHTGATTGKVLLAEMIQLVKHRGGLFVCREMDKTRASALKIIDTPNLQ